MYEFLDRRYAQALYDVALKKNKVEEFREDLTEIAHLIENSPETDRIIHHPEISIKQKKDFFITLFKNRIDEDLLTFLLVLVEKDRILYLKEKLEEFNKIDMEHKNTIVAHVRSAVPLTDPQRERLKQALGKKHHKTIVLDEKVEREILGGLLVKVGDELIDGTLRHHLGELKEQLSNALEGNQHEN